MPGYVHESFSTSASENADVTAIWSESESITYAELDRRSTALACWLNNRLDGSSHRIALLLPKSVSAITAIFGILKSGNTYVPLGDSWSDARLNKIIADGDFSLLITESADRQLTLEHDKILDTHTGQWSDLLASEDKQQFQQPELTDSSLAYLLYTSGSTGIPKGVCVSHRAARHFPDWARAEFNLQPGDRIASVSPLTFDLTTFDLFSTLSSGATLYLVPDKLKILPARLSKFLEEHAITCIYAVPSTLTLLQQRGKLANRDLSPLKTILFAGEPYPVPLFQKLKALMPDHIKYTNLYGPTETNVCTYFHVPEEFVEPQFPIGYALPDMHLFIKPTEEDTDQNGVLCAAGPTVMSGYHGKDNKQAEYWVDDPRSIETHAYVTGDLVSHNGDGIWHYHGRFDNMVKIWGYRVELGEIETCLLEVKHIKQAVVVKRTGDDSQSDELVAYLQCEERYNNDDNSDEFTNSVKKDAILHCKNTLPPYMVPRNVIFVDQMPLNATGKIDRRKLEAQLTI